MISPGCSCTSWPTDIIINFSAVTRIREIAAVWKAAVEEGLYDEVLYCHGIRKPAYAKNNPQEYFAELSEAWFGVNDFFPFVRAEVISTHDSARAPGAVTETLGPISREPPKSPKSRLYSNRPKPPPARSVQHKTPRGDDFDNHCISAGKSVIAASRL